MDHDALLKELKEQEERLQFTVFTNEMAVEIGMYLYQKAREEKRTTYTMKKRLTKSRKERMLFGVCGGLGEYFGIDRPL